jgi:hypothetical protein
VLGYAGVEEVDSGRHMILYIWRDTTTGEAVTALSYDNRTARPVFQQIEEQVSPSLAFRFILEAYVETNPEGFAVIPLSEAAPQADPLPRELTILSLDPDHLKFVIRARYALPDTATVNMHFKNAVGDLVEISGTDWPTADERQFLSGYKAGLFYYYRIFYSWASPDDAPQDDDDAEGELPVTTASSKVRRDLENQLVLAHPRQRKDIQRQFDRALQKESEEKEIIRREKAESKKRKFVAEKLEQQEMMHKASAAEPEPKRQKIHSPLVDVNDEDEMAEWDTDYDFVAGEDEVDGEAGDKDVDEVEKDEE